MQQVESRCWQGRRVLQRVLESRYRRPCRENELQKEILKSINSQSNKGPHRHKNVVLVVVNSSHLFAGPCSSFSFVQVPETGRHKALSNTKLQEFMAVFARNPKWPKTLRSCPVGHKAPRVFTGDLKGLVGKQRRNCLTLCSPETESQ